MLADSLPQKASAPKLKRSKAGHTVTLRAILFLVATGSILPAQTEPSRGSVLFPIYHEYVIAMEVRDLDKLHALSSDEESKQQLEKLKELKDEKQQKAMFDLMVGTQPESPEIVNEKIVGDKGLLAIQGYSRGDVLEIHLDPHQVPKGFRLAHNKPIRKRQYQLVLFEKIRGEWKICRMKSFTYEDPRPVFEATARTDRNIKGCSSIVIFRRRTSCRATNNASG
jgi:hypothetical protein